VSMREWKAIGLSSWPRDEEGEGAARGLLLLREGDQVRDAEWMMLRDDASPMEMPRNGSECHGVSGGRSRTLVRYGDW